MASIPVLGTLQEAWLMLRTNHMSIHYFSYRRKGLCAIAVLLSVLLLSSLSLAGDLRVTTEPQGAKVTVDGKEVGVTPTTLYDLTEGQYTLIVQLAGFLPYTAHVEIGQKGKEKLHISLQRAPSPGRLFIRSEPAAATVVLEGEDLGKTPLTTKAMPVGTYDLTLRLAGHRQHGQLVAVSSDRTEEVFVTLEPRYGQLTVISSVEGAVVSLDGES